MLAHVEIGCECVSSRVLALLRMVLLMISCVFGIVDVGDCVELREFMREMLVHACSTESSKPFG